jgi:thiamine-phosphate diphosphorylase
VNLPPLLVLTDRRQACRPLPAVVASAVDGGARAIVLREKDLPEPERQRLAGELRSVLPSDGLLIVAGRGAGDAVHLPAGAPVPVPRPAIVGRSCHNAAEIDASSDVDYVTASPIFPTPSKPGYGPPLGLAGLLRLTAPGTPVYALGGITERNAAGCRQAGAAGIAVMGTIMRATDAGSVVRHLLAAWHGAARHVEARHGAARHVEARHGAARHVEARHGAARHVEARHG